MMPRSESSIREVISILDKFEIIAGVKGTGSLNSDLQQAAAGSQGSGGRLNQLYSAVEVVVTGAHRCIPCKWEPYGHTWLSD